MRQMKAVIIGVLLLLSFSARADKRFIARLAPDANTLDITQFAAGKRVFVKYEFFNPNTKFAILTVNGEVEDVNRLRAKLGKRVLYVEPVRSVALQAEKFPNDKFFVRQCALATIKAPAAWDIRHDAPAVIVAIIDSGIDENNPELKDNIDSRHTFMHGVETVNEAKDTMGHGTEMASIIAAMGDNGAGIAGVVWKTN